MTQEQAPIHILVVDDHPVVRHGVRDLLSKDPYLTIVGEAGSAPKALEQIKALQPDVVLLDIKLPGSDGVELTRQVRNLYTEIKIIILTAYRDEEYLLGALRAGAHGFLLKQASYETLAEAIHKVYAGERLLSPSLITRVLEEFETVAREQIVSESDLTTRELEILNHLAAGDSTQEMADALHWSEATVNRCIHDILSKLNVSNRAHAVAEAIRRGLI